MKFEEAWGIPDARIYLNESAWRKCLFHFGTSWWGFADNSNGALLKRPHQDMEIVVYFSDDDFYAGNLDDFASQ